MKHGADWYKREPTAFLGGVQGLTSKEHAVFSVVLDLIYQHGGSCNNDAAWFAGWIQDMGPSAVRKVIASLVEKKKLTLDGDFLTNNRAQKQAETKEKLAETRAKSGQKGGINSGKSRADPINNKELSEALASPRLDKRREEKEKDTNVSQKNSRKSRIPKDAVLSEKQLAISKEQGHDRQEAEAQFVRFKDYCLANGKAYVDWDAAWRNWFTSPFFKLIGGQSGNGHSNHTQGQRRDAALENIANLFGVGET